MAGKRYRDLQKQVNKLRRGFLPRTFSPTSEYSELVYMRCSAFRVFAHAEYEHFLEDIVRTVARDALGAWQASRAPSNVLTALCAAYPYGKELPVTVNDASGFQEQRIRKSVEAHIQATKHNHGIRVKNLVRLIVPLGLEVDKLEAEWIGALDAWGADRGAIAHESLMSIQQMPDPKRSWEDAKVITEGFKRLDEAVAGL